MPLLAHTFSTFHKKLSNILNYTFLRHVLHSEWQFSYTTGSTHLYK